MNKKSFFRGFGVGVLFAALILGISFMMRTSDSYVKSRAKELGMVYANEDSDKVLASKEGDATAEPEVTPDASKEEKKTKKPEGTEAPKGTQIPKNTQPASPNIHAARAATAVPARPPPAPATAAFHQKSENWASLSGRPAPAAQNIHFWRSKADPDFWRSAPTHH